MYWQRKKLLHKLTLLLKFLREVLKHHVQGALKPNKEVQGGVVRLILNELYLGKKEGSEFLTFLRTHNELHLRLLFKVFPDSLKDWKLGFLNVALIGLLSFSQFMEKIKN